MRVVRLGGGSKGSNIPRRSWKLETNLSGYVDMMIRMAGKAAVWEGLPRRRLLNLMTRLQCLLVVTN
ncbi:hypothetical protein EV2_011425 [Malus domestica]